MISILEPPWVWDTIVLLSRNKFLFTYSILFYSVFDVESGDKVILDSVAMQFHFLPRVDTTGVCFRAQLLLRNFLKGLHIRRPQLLL